VSVSHSKEGACRFGTVGDGKMGRPVDIFIDRPENTSIVFSEGEYQLLMNLTEASESDRFFFGDTTLAVIENRSAVPVVELSSTTQAIESLIKLKSEGYSKVILAGGEDKIPDSLRNRLEEEGFNTERVAKGNRSYTGWVANLVGLQSSPRLDFDPRGECVYDAVITGSTATLEDARLQVQRNQILLTSGNLPVKLTIESESTTPPTLGRRFLAYSFYTGIVAIAAVAMVVFLRYRRAEILIPVMATGTGEIIIILGVAACINWELDLPAIAGIIASVGTGVNDQIVITDETLKHPRQRKTISVAERIRRAFFIVLTAAATIVAAMIPLLGIGAGMLKGFAFTTIIGVLIGVIITRPGYAKVIESIVRKME
jgi:preprotein translocase subunit SecD